MKTSPLARRLLPVLLLGVSTLAACEQMQATANRADGKPKTAKTETKSDDTRMRLPAKEARL